MYLGLQHAGWTPLDLKTADDKSGVLISTVLLPVDHSQLGGNYETCIFDEANRGCRLVLGRMRNMCDSDVVERYQTIELARVGHEKWVERVARLGFAAVKEEP